MNNYRGVIPLLIETTKKERVRLQKSDFNNLDVERRNEHVVIFGHSGCQLIDRFLECGKSGRAAKMLAQCSVLRFHSNNITTLQKHGHTPIGNT